MSEASRPGPALSVLDQVPIPDGGTTAQAIRDSIDLAALAERNGYRNHWFAEHHLGAGRAGAAPAVLVALAVAATETIGLGSAASVLPHHSALFLVEHFATTAELHPGRITVGVGRGLGYDGAESDELLDEVVATIAEAATSDDFVPVDLTGSGSGRAWDLLQYLATVPVRGNGSDARLRELLHLIERPLASYNGSPLQATPGLGSTLGVTVFGSSAGASAALAAALGLPFTINAHSIAHDVVEAAESYRSAFVPSRRLDRPVVGVSTHAVVAPDADEAAFLARSYAATLSGLIRDGVYHPVPAPEREVLEVDAADREHFERVLALSTSGTADEVAGRLHHLADRTGADEVLVSTIVHDPVARLRSYELLAAAW